MKTIFLALAMTGLSACGSADVKGSSVKAAEDGTFLVNLCGTIFRPALSPVGGGDDVRIKQLAQDGSEFEVVLVAGNAEVASQLEAIKFPNDRYIGCARGNSTLAQGYEGWVFLTGKLDLQGQP